MPLENAIIEERCPLYFLHDELSDRHSRFEQYAGRAKVDHFQRKGTVPIGMDGRGREVDEQTDPCPATLAFDPSGKTGLGLLTKGVVYRQSNAFSGLS